MNDNESCVSWREFLSAEDENLFEIWNFSRKRRSYAEKRKIARKNEQFTNAMITSDPGNNLRAFDA